jgi:hypothetical protein
MKMKCIISPFNCCYQNIGSEEYYLSRFEEDIFYLISTRLPSLLEDTRIQQPRLTKHMYARIK